MNEDQLEQLCLEWFTENGWETAHGPDIAHDGAAPERQDYRQVVLPADLEAAIRRINRHLPDNAVEQAIAQVLKPESLDVVVGNRAFHRLLLEGVPVEYKALTPALSQGEREQVVHDHALLIDFERLESNRFRAINQFTIAGSKQLRRPDLVCFINGLPIAMLELKSPAAENADVLDAFNQIQTYKDELSDLFVFNEALVVSDGFKARVGSLTANSERFMPWRTIKHEDDKPLLEWQLETLVRGFFDRELLLDYIRYFVLFETDSDKLIKKIAGYHQFHAVREAVRATVIAAQGMEARDRVAEGRPSYGSQVMPGSKKAGVVWHTQGSGKSISMCCYAGKLLQQPEMNNPTLIVVTDRNDLDGQLFKTFTDSKGRGEPTHSAEEAFAILLEKLDILHGMFAKGPKGSGFDYSTFETEPHKLLVPAANYILGLEDGKKRFLDTVLALSKAYSLCSTLDQARELHKEIAFLSAIKVAITKHTSVDRKLTQEEKNSALKQILDNAIVAEGVADVFALCGLDKPNIGLLSDEFLEDVRQMPYKNLAVELLEKLLKDDIRAKTRNNVVQEKKYAERLQETLRKYNNRGIETAQVIEELIALAKQFQEEMEREAALGLNPDEIAFYDALANNESAVRKLGDEILKKIAVEITDKLRKSTTVDWQVRESVRAKLRILVRRTLQRYKYPPDQAPEAVELVLKQAEVLSNGWAA